MTDTFKVGAAACRQFRDYFLMMNPTAKIKYITKADEQFKGYDFKTKIDDGPVMTWEIKGELTYTRNLCVEHWSDADVRPGWARTSVADKLVTMYHDDEYGRMYVFDMPLVKQWVDDPKVSKGKEITQKKYEQNNTTKFYIPPLEFMTEYANGVVIPFVHDQNWGL